MRYKIGDKVEYIKDMLALNCFEGKNGGIFKKKVIGELHKINKDFCVVYYPQNLNSQEVAYHSAKYNEIKILTD